MKATLSQLAANKLCVNFFLNDRAAINTASILEETKNDQTIRLELHSDKHQGNYLLTMPRVSFPDLRTTKGLNNLLQYIQGEIAELQGIDEERSIAPSFESDAGKAAKAETLQYIEILDLAMSVTTSRRNIYTADAKLQLVADRVIPCQFAAARAVAQVLRNFYPESDHVFNPLDNDELMKGIYNYIKHNTSSIAD